MRSQRVSPAADGSVLVTEGGSKVGIGVLATDVQHGNRGGGALHGAATTVTPGFISAADKANLDGLVAGTVNGSAFFGDGADGAVSIGTAAVTQPLTRATTFHATGNVTPQTGSRNGMIIRSTSTMTIDGGASINADGVSANGTNGGAAGVAGTALASANQTQLFANPAAVAGGLAGTGGAAGAVGTAGGAGNTGNTLQGGTGGGGGGGGGGTIAAGNNGGAGGASNVGTNFDEHRWARIRWDPIALPGFLNNATTGVFVGTGGTGGGGGGTGGGPGGTGGAGGGAATANGGGFVYLAAPILTGAGRISANGDAGVVGNNGANSALQGGGGGGGGSGAGSGGLVVIKSKSVGGGLTIQANGGTGGAGGTGGTAGVGAAAGSSGGAGGAGGAGIVQTSILP